MRLFRALVKKGLLDGRWTLGLSSLSLFGLSWMFVYVAARIERSLAEAQAEGRAPRAGMFRGMGGAAMDFSTAAIQMAFWKHPFVILTIAIWAIARGTAAVGGELERGSMDIILSRPVSRTTYLMSQVVTALVGLGVLVSALVLGNVLGSMAVGLSSPVSAKILARPGMNLYAMGVIMFGYTLLFSSVDSVRWRPNLLGSVATLVGFILQIVVNLPTLEDWKWLGKYSIFSAYDPVEAVVKGEKYLFNSSVLLGLGLVLVALSAASFSRRDLPTPG
ncbi:MAG: ABC transporter permease subunit [Isosphaeraceae bacterium]|nr:ABC transporter permease subunit [Isosphaeraceae bacterium]